MEARLARLEAIVEQQQQTQQKSSSCNCGVSKKRLEQLDKSLDALKLSVLELVTSVKDLYAEHLDNDETTIVNDEFTTGLFISIKCLVSF